MYFNNINIFFPFVCYFYFPPTSFLLTIRTQNICFNGILLNLSQKNQRNKGSLLKNWVCKSKVRMKQPLYVTFF